MQRTPLIDLLVEAAAALHTLARRRQAIEEGLAAALPGLLAPHHATYRPREGEAAVALSVEDGALVAVALRAEGWRSGALLFTARAGGARYVLNPALGPEDLARPTYILPQHLWDAVAAAIPGLRLRG